MSLIHWDRSVLSFHLKEILEDSAGNHPIAIAGLGIITVSSFLIPAVTKLGKPILKAAIKNSLSFYPGNRASSAESSKTQLLKIWEQAGIASQTKGSSS